MIERCACGDGVAHCGARRKAKALDEPGWLVTTVDLAGELHWLSRSDTRIRMLEEIGRFLAQHLGPKAG